MLNSQPVRSISGDLYPHSAAWAAHLIDRPYSPVSSKVPVVGIARPASHSAVFELHPGPSRWTDAAKRRFADLKAPDWAARTYYHVEMQVAAWMVSSEVIQAELVLNREPYGERFGRGCHQALPFFLPITYRLSVSGTRGGNRYYSYSYEGEVDL